jgi:hypothetical protein
MVSSESDLVLMESWLACLTRHGRSVHMLAADRHLALFLLLCLSFFTLWTWNLSSHGLSGDEAFVAILSTRPAGEILQRLNSDEPHPPAYYLTMRAWYLLVGTHHEFLVRYPSLLAGLLLFGLIYRLGRELRLGRSVALIPVLMLALNPQLILHLREARMYGPMLVSISLAALVTLHFQRSFRPACRWLVTTAFVLALLSHYFNVFFVAAFTLWGLLANSGEQRRRWILSQALAGALFGVWLVFMGRGFFNAENLAMGKTWSYILPAGETIRRLMETGLFGYRYIPEQWPIVFSAALLLTGGWLAGALSGRGKRRWFLLLAVLLPVGTFALVAWYRPIFHAKYLLPWLLFATLALGRLVQYRPRIGYAVVAALLLLMILPAWRTIQAPYDPGLPGSRGDSLHPYARHLSGALLELAQPDHIFGVCAPDPARDYYANYYFNRRLGYALLPEYPGQSLMALEKELNQLFVEHPVLWLLDCYNPYWDPERVAEAALKEQGLLLGIEEIAGSRVRLYTGRERVWREQKVVAARFGAEPIAELAGIWLVQGQSLYLVLLWRSLAEQPAAAAKVFVHLVDTDGQIVSQSDGVPVEWARPLATWRQDERLLDVHRLPLTDSTVSTTWALRIGLYDADTGTRMPAYDHAGNRLPDNAVPVPNPEAWGK